MQIDWNLINENLRKFCENYKIIQKEVNPKIMCLLDMVFDEYIKYGQNYDMRKIIVDPSFVEPEESLEIVSDFFKNINENLYNEFRNNIYDSNYTKIEINEYGESNVKNNILNLSFKQNSEDKYMICHESIHRMFSCNFSDDDPLILLNKQMFLETNSCTFERLLYSNTKDKFFLKKRTIDDFNKTITYLFFDWISTVYLKQNKINLEIFNDEFNKIPNKNLQKAFYEYLNSLIALVQLNRMNFQFTIFRYIIGSTLSSTLITKIQNKELSIEEYLHLMSKLNTINTYEEGLDLLNLNYIKNNGILENIRKNYSGSCQELFIREMGDNRCKK